MCSMKNNKKETKVLHKKLLQKLISIFLFGGGGLGWGGGCV